MMTEEILEQARVLWASSRRQSRDAKIAVGRLLREHVLSMMRQADAANAKLPSREWVGARPVRDRAVRDSARHLGIKDHTVRRLIQGSAVVDLLGEGVDLGGVSWSSVLQFRLCVERTPVSRRKAEGADHVRRSSKDDGGITLEQRERWHVRGDVGVLRTLFRRAVTEGLDAAEVRSLLPRKAAPGTARSREQPEQAAPPSADAFLTGSPRDVVETLLAAIRKTEDADAILALLAAELKRPQPIRF